MSSVAKRAGDGERVQALASNTSDLLAREVPDPEDPRFDNFEAWMREVRRQADEVDHLLARYAWPDDLPEPEALAALKRRRGDLAGVAEESDARSAALLEQVAASIAELRQSIDEGSVHDAVERDRQLRELVRGLPRAKAQEVSSELAELGARVRDLRGLANLRASGPSARRCAAKSKSLPTIPSSRTSKCGS